MKRSILIGFFIAFSVYANAQYDAEEYDVNSQTFSERLIFGGGFGLQFGDYTYVDISPTVGYKLTNNFVPGISITYKYLKDNYYKYETDIYGGSVFLRYYIIPQIFAHAEYEILSYKAYDSYFSGMKRVEVHSIFGGGGYRQKLGERSYLNLMVLYNFNESPYSFYQNPIIRMSFDIGL